MVSYKITVTDQGSDELVITSTNGVCDLKGNKFTIPVDSEKIKRLVDSISSMGILLTDFNFKEINIEKIE